MCSILGDIPWSVKDKLCRQWRRCGRASVRLRYLIVINLLNGRSAYETADVLGVHNTTVYRVARRFRERGPWGLWDAREDNGQTKLDEHYLGVLYRLSGKRRKTTTGVGRPGLGNCWSRRWFESRGYACMSRP